VCITFQLCGLRILLHEIRLLFVRVLISKFLTFNFRDLLSTLQFLNLSISERRTSIFRYRLSTLVSTLKFGLSSSGYGRRERLPQEVR